MKTILLTLLPFLGFGQLKEIEPSVLLYQDVQYFKLTQSDSSYTFFYKDKQYEHITSIGYLSFENFAELDQFINGCINAIENDKQLLTVKYSIRKGLNNAVVYDGSKWFFINKKKLLKIKSKYDNN